MHALSWRRRARTGGAVALAVAIAAVMIVPQASAGARAPDSPVTHHQCDPLDLSVCLFPFPNDYFAIPDTATATGMRVNFSPLAMPSNVEGKPIDPTEWNRNDGFSPGSMILTHVPGIDLARTGAPSITDVATSLDKKSPIAIVDAATLQRVPLWAELDSHATSDAERSLIVRPAIDLSEGHRYIVALSNMRDGNGNLIPSSATFRDYRDGISTTDPDIEARRAHMEDLFGSLKRAHVKRQDLYLAWDFTVASGQNLAGRMLHIRDDAFSSLGDGLADGKAPAFSVGSVTNFTPSQNTNIARRVTGTFTVPNYLTEPRRCGLQPALQLTDCSSAVGARFDYAGATDVNGRACTIVDPDCLPQQLGTLTANFVCNIPRATVADATSSSAVVTPAKAVIYGHGLLGAATEVNSGAQTAMANEHNYVYCATNWSGMAGEDLPNVVTILHDVSTFPSLADQGQQGMLNFLYLGRLMIDPDGFIRDAAFEAGDPTHPTPVIDAQPGNLFYDGNSQGGIMGGALTAVAQDFTRAVLGVPGMNYSLLLNRSSDWEGEGYNPDPSDPGSAIPPYSLPFYDSYPQKMDQQLIFALMQMLWDRAEADGYAQHMTTNPYPNTPAHQVLLHMAFGDHQVTNVATEIEARTIGASIYQPALAPGRSYEVQPFWGIPSISGFPFFGSGLVVWDSGTPTPPTGNQPNFGGDDPHGRPRSQVTARNQKAVFLQPNGYVIDVCGGQPCLAP